MKNIEYVVGVDMRASIKYLLPLCALCFCSGIISHNTALMIGCWLPYWRASASIKSFVEHCSCFDQVSPFSYEVNGKGKIIDPFKKNGTTWNTLYELCQSGHKLMVPTIFWSDTHALSACLGNKEDRTRHVEAIVRLVCEKKYDGININYERVRSQDRWPFINLMQQLSRRLHAEKKVLYCSIGGRVSDNSISLFPDKTEKKNKNAVNVSLNPGKGKESFRYKKLLMRCCDQIHLMGYDEWGRPYQYNNEDYKNEYYVSHCSHQWIEGIIRYALSFVPAEKLVLGIPTYGLEFIVTDREGALFFKKARNVTYPQASELAHTWKVTPRRTSGGELSFLYNNGVERRYVCYVDSTVIKDRIDLARRYGLKGVYIFKVDGIEDPAMWDVLSQACKKEGDT